MYTNVNKRTIILHKKRFWQFSPSGCWLYWEKSHYRRRNALIKHPLKGNKRLERKNNAIESGKLAFSTAGQAIGPDISQSIELIDLLYAGRGRDFAG
ncbi:TPA: hypothetical protein ACKP1B_003157 [Serratia fonticola]